MAIERWEKTKRWRKDYDSNKKNNEEKNESGSSTLNRMKDGSKSKMGSGNKDLCGDYTGKKNDEKTKNKDITFIVLQKMRSMHWSERIEEMVCEFEGYRWDATSLSETWRQDKSEIWETHHKHIFMGAGKYDNKHGVGIMLNKKCRHRIIDTEYINDRAITATIVVKRQRIELMSLYFPHSGYADHHIEKMYKTRKKHTTNCKRYIPIVGGDFNAELGLGHRTECTSVGRYTLNEGKQKRWLDEALADGTRIHSTQHDVQKNKHLRKKRLSYLQKVTRNKSTTY